MESRFLDYSCLITYLGELDTESFKVALIDALGDGVKFMPRIKDDVLVMTYDGNQLIRINLLYYIERGIFSDEEKKKYVEDLRAKIKSIIYQELKSQKLIFNFEN